MPIGALRLQPELFHHFEGGRRIDREPGAHRRAGRIVDLVDQAGGQFDELPRLVGRVRIGLNLEIGQDAQQSGTDIDALTAGERHQPIEAGK